MWCVASLAAELSVWLVSVESRSSGRRSRMNGTVCDEKEVKNERKHKQARVKSRSHPLAATNIIYQIYTYTLLDYVPPMPTKISNGPFFIDAQKIPIKKRRL